VLESVPESKHPSCPFSIDTLVCNDYANFLDNAEKMEDFFADSADISVRVYASPPFSVNMSAIDSLFSTTANTPTPINSDRMNELTMSDFIKMMVAELENQDPMNPMSNTEMLQQISQMRSITSSDRLTNGIEALTLGQALSTASSLIAKRSRV